MSGLPEPLGVTLSGEGINVAIVSTAAEAIELCLFDGGGSERRVALDGRTGDVFHAQIPGVVAGAAYGLRAHGPWDPQAGHRFNPAKLLIDPHARGLDRVARLQPSMFGHRADDPDRPDAADSAPHAPRCLVTASPDALDVARPGTAWADSVIYELHVRGFTKLHPGIPEAIRGTFAGLAHPAAVEHLTRLGVTAVEVMPPAAWIEERHLVPLGLTNYWGYNPLAFMAPDLRLAPGGWAEIRAAVATLAASGIETIVDVVLNHSGEGDALGPTLSLRGLDNAMYYRLRNGYVDDSGCGNTLALDRPHVVRLAMDALRCWAVLGGVHGFRFDLAPIMGRREEGFDPAAPLLTAIAQDPILRGLRLIAEPWDIGWGGYRLGGFPGGWGEWNDHFRDDARAFWRGDAGTMGALASRLAGSADFLGGHRRPSRGINFVTAHDGFTLADLVSFETKRNLANGEGNRDGTDANRSWNNGVEGPSDDEVVVAARRRDQVALLATLLLSRGTPMISMGSELGHSQAGNNNAYAQDGPLAWLDWAAADMALLDAARRLVTARRAHPALRNDRFLTGTGDPPDVAWLRPDGTAMQSGDWAGADTLTAVFAAGERVAVVIHRGAGPATVILPTGEWRDALGAATGITVAARSVGLFVAA